MHHQDLAAIAFVLVAFGGPITWGIVNRVLAHRERMAMIERGIVPPAGDRFRRGGWSAQAPPVPGYPPGPAPGSPPDLAANGSADTTLRKGLVLTFVGIALTIGLSFIGYQGSGPLGVPSIEPGPWLLGGLIPMFIGAAQVLIAVLAGASLAGLRRGYPPPPPRYAPPHAACPDEPIAPPPWAGRPDYQELKPPRDPQAGR